MHKDRPLRFKRQPVKIILSHTDGSQQRPSTASRQGIACSAFWSQQSDDAHIRRTAALDSDLRLGECVPHAICRCVADREAPWNDFTPLLSAT